MDNIAGEDLQLSLTLIGLDSAHDFNFQVRAKNIYGYGELSDTFVVRTSDVPDTMNPIITLSVMSTFIISWETPSNGGEDLD